jgi:hypothetical protein
MIQADKADSTGHCPALADTSAERLAGAKFRSPLNPFRSAAQTPLVHRMIQVEEVQKAIQPKERPRIARE